MISRMALVRATPGTRTISVEMVTTSTLVPSPASTSVSDKNAATALHTAVRKKLLAPMNFPPQSRQRPTARPQKKEQAVSGRPPPNSGAKKAGATP